jgi:hypothetical protein
MGQLIFALLILVLFTVAWGEILTKAGYSGWLAILMWIPIVNLIWLLVFAYSQWPIEAKLIQLGGGSPPEKPQQRQILDGVLVEEQIKESGESSVDEMFNEAFELDQRGDWVEAVALYERIADELQGHQDGEYARSCAQQIREQNSGND